MKTFIVLVMVLFFCCFSLLGSCCKDLVAVGDSTDGDYNLLLKVRDPSRPGLQVLTIIPKGYSYSYHHPWNGDIMHFSVNHSFIGIATEGDIPPGIVKPGMALSDAAIAYADADSPLIWVNPSQYAWDDFDWMRYACQEASTEDEAVSLLTSSAVDNLHAPGLGENLFIVGPQKAFVIESDAYRYSVREITDVAAQSNYPKALWKRSLFPLLISPDFNHTIEKTVHEKRTIRLGWTVFGVKIIDIQPTEIEVRNVPFGQKVRIPMGDTKTVGEFRVTLIDTIGRRATIRLSYHYLDWEKKILDIMNRRYGKISLKDMISWSRLHDFEAEGLRNMCEGGFEASCIYKIPHTYPEILSSGWFAPDQCCSLFVPFHISNKDIYEPYTTGVSHTLSLDLLDLFGHGTLSSHLGDVEDILLAETQSIETIATQLIDEGKKDSAVNLLTISDLGIQKQAFLWEQVLLKVGQIQMQNETEMDFLFDNIWSTNYSTTLQNLKRAITNITHQRDFNKTDLNIISQNLIDIVITIAESKIREAESINGAIEETQILLDTAFGLLEEGQYIKGLDYLEEAYHTADTVLMGKNLDTLEDTGETAFSFPLLATTIVLVFLGVVIIYLKIR